MLTASDDSELEKEMERRAVEYGLLEKAQKNAENVLRNLLGANPIIAKYYKIEFKVVE